MATTAVRALVLRGYGFNCEEETAAGYRLCAAVPTVAFASDWFAGRVDLADFDLLHLPGGFTFSDDLGSGLVFANRLKHGFFPDGTSIWASITAFMQGGGRIIGVCNGFQILVRAGLVPNIGGTFAQEVSLAANLSGHFEDRWVRCVADETGALRLGRREFELPVRHGEGRLVFGSSVLRDEALARGLIALRYADADGQGTAAYPANPNGAEEACAGLFSSDGAVFGLMPHPEAYLTPYNHPAWAARFRQGVMDDATQSDGLALLRGVVAGAAAAKAARC